MLHLVSRIEALNSLQERLAEQDAVLLLGDAVTALQPGHQFQPLLVNMIAMSVHISVLQEMLAAVGLADQPLLAGVESIDYAQFVILTEQHHPVVTWS